MNREYNIMVKNNINRTLELMDRYQVGALIANRMNNNFIYLTGFPVLDIKWYLNRYVAVLIHKERKLILLLAAPDIAFAKSLGIYDEIIGLPLITSTWPKIIGNILGRHHITTGRVGYDPEMKYDIVCGLINRFSGIDFVSAGELLSEAGLIKNIWQINIITRAIRTVEKAASVGFEKLVSGMTEKALSRVINEALLDSGVDALGFPSIVSSGLNFAAPIRYATEKKIGTRELANFCICGQITGYHGELHRMTSLCEPIGEARDIYSVVYGALIKGIEAIKPGNPLKGMDCAIRNYIRDAGYGEYEQKHGSSA